MTSLAIIELERATEPPISLVIGFSFPVPIGLPISNNPVWRFNTESIVFEAAVLINPWVCNGMNLEVGVSLLTNNEVELSWPINLLPILLLDITKFIPLL